MLVSFFKDLGISISIVYILLGLFLFFFQKGYLYYPDSTDLNSCSSFSNYKLIDMSGTRGFFKEVKGSDSVIIFYHGNAGSVCHRGNIKELFEVSNSSILFVEYFGYSSVKDKPSKKMILEDVKNVNEFILNKNFKETIIFGESLGTGAASYHSTLSNVDKLFLIAPFSSLLDVASDVYFYYPVRLLFTENLDNVEFLKDFSGEIKIVSGDKDNVIKPKFHKKLFDSLNSPKKSFDSIPGYSHNDIYQSEQVKDLIKDFVK